MKITILADNAATPPYRAEHGFSALVETTRKDDAADTILFDVGMGAIFENAALAGIDLSRVGDVVLSHGHYDHTDALSPFIEKYPAARVHASGEILRAHYSLRTGTCRNIALSEGNRAILSSLPEGLFKTFMKTDSILDGRIHLAGNIARINPLEKTSPLLYEDPECTIPDEVIDEIVLWAETDAGLVILTGCCHSGFINTCEQIRAVSGIDTIYAVIGGLHLANVSEERLQATADYIRTKKIARVIPCHCTGDAEIEWLRIRLGSDIVTKGECGMTIKI